MIRRFVLVVMALNCGIQIAIAANGFPPCDNNCRMKLSHQYTIAPIVCIQFAVTSCINCQPGLTVLCTAEGRGRGSCNQTTIQNFASYYDSCNPSCEPAGMSIVEAKDMTGRTGQTWNIEKYQCL